MTPNITDMTYQQLLDWLASIVSEEIFASREKLIVLLAENSPHEALGQEFREFFNGLRACLGIRRVRGIRTWIYKRERRICTFKTPCFCG